MGKTFNLVVGAKYRITHQNDAQRYPRFSVAIYLGEQRGGGGKLETIWSMRPLAGTTTMPLAWIHNIQAVTMDTPIQINQRVRT